MSERKQPKKSNSHRCRDEIKMDKALEAKRHKIINNRLVNEMSSSSSPNTHYHELLEYYEDEYYRKEDMEELQADVELRKRLEKYTNGLRDDIKDCKEHANKHEKLKLQNLDYEEEIIKLKIELAESKSNLCMQENDINVTKTRLFNKAHGIEKNETPLEATSINNSDNRRGSFPNVFGLIKSASLQQIEEDNHTTGQHNNDVIRPLTLVRPKSQRSINNNDAKGSFSNLFGLVKSPSSLLVQIEENDHAIEHDNNATIRNLTLVRPKSQRIKTKDGNTK